MRILFFVLAFSANGILLAQKAEEITITLGSAELHGTLLIPDEYKNSTVALIISGSGPTDRDGNNPNMENNSLKYLAIDLAQQEIASLRYDKRGVGESSDSTIHEEDVDFNDFVNDAERWIHFLKNEKNFKNIVVIGHSEGSLVGILAVQKIAVTKFISIAGASQPANEILLDQITAGSPFFAVPSKNILDSLSNGHRVKYIPPALDVLFRQSVQPYLISWFKYNPTVEIAKLQIPVLVIQGTTDIQVSVSNAENLAKAASNSKLVIVDQMNHVLKQSSEDKTENIKTYANPNLPVVKKLVDEIVDFINEE